MLIDETQVRARSAIHLLFLDERMRPDSASVVTDEGILIASVADLVKMKLTSYRIKDRVHIQDLDAVGLITPDIERHLPAVLRQRLADNRASE